MRDFIKAQADKAGRSMTTEILTRLEEAYRAETSKESHQLGEIQSELAELRKMVMEIARRLDKK